MVAQVAGKRPLGAVGRAGMVVGMHAALLFVIAQGFVLENKVEAPPPDIEARFHPDDPIVEPPIEVTRPTLDDPTIRVPAPDVQIEVPMDLGLTAEVAPPDLTIVDPPRGSGPDIPTTNVRMLSSGLTQPPYPASMRRQGIEGTTELEVYVLPNGRVGDVRVLKSAGNEAFDLSAMNEAKRSWRFAPATRAGEPLAQWYRLRVVFKLENER